MPMHARVDRTHDVPFAGGAARKGSKIFVDRRIKGGFHFKGRFYKAIRFLVLHEQVEESKLRRGLSYAKAHAQAEKVEFAALRKAKIPVRAYKSWTAKFVKASGHERTHKISRGLDRRPYTQTGSSRLLRRK